MIPVILAALVEDMVDTPPLEQSVCVVDMLVCQIATCRITRDIAYYVKDGHSWVLCKRLARQRLLAAFDTDCSRNNGGEQQRCLHFAMNFARAYRPVVTGRAVIAI